MTTYPPPGTPTRHTIGADRGDDWTIGAACAQVGGDGWFPDKGESTRPAKGICNGDDTRPPCPIRVECLAYALEHNERFGIWGGLSERERRRLRLKQESLARIEAA